MSSEREFVRNDDFTFVQRCLAGERDAFRHLVENHQQRVFHTILRMVYNRETARDLSQETFVKAYTKLHTFNPQYPFRVWIQRIATHCAIDYLRRKKPEYLTLDDTTNPDRPPLSQQIRDTGRTPDTTLEQREEADMVRAAVADLDPKLKAVIILRHFRDMNYDEISECLQIPLGTVKNRIFRARNKLQQILRDRIPVAGEVSS